MSSSAAAAAAASSSSQHQRAGGSGAGSAVGVVVGASTTIAAAGAGLTTSATTTAGTTTCTGVGTTATTKTTTTTLLHSEDFQARMGQILDDQDHKRCSEGNHRALLAENLDQLRGLLKVIESDDWKYEKLSGDGSNSTRGGIFSGNNNNGLSALFQTESDV